MNETIAGRLVVLLSVLWLLNGCASQQGCVTPVGPSGLTPANAASLGQGEGVVVTWGGVIASTRNLPQETEIEVIGYPLDRCGEPLTRGQPTGRFVARHSGFLEPSDYRSDRRITATGRIGPVREGRVGEASYRFPVLEDAVVRLWPDHDPRDTTGWTPRVRPWIGIGIGSGGYGGVGGGIGIGF